MSKLNVKIMKKIILISSVIGALVLGINYTFCYPTVVNEFIATKVYWEPANSYFDDENFYKCVVDAYNKENKTSLPYTTSLSDEQLQTITFLSCSNKSITSAKGIEKLISLTQLNISYNQLTSLDLRNNIKLIRLGASKNQLTDLDLSKNMKLIYLYANDNQLINLDLSNNKELKEIFIYNNQLNSINLSNNSLLTHLNVGKNQLTELDVSSLIELTKLYAYDNHLTSLNLDRNEKLVLLSLSGNLLEEINLINNAELNKLDLGGSHLRKVIYFSGESIGGGFTTDGNNIKKLDISNNVALTELYISNNQLTELNISNNTALTTLDVSNNTSLKDNNQLTTLDVSKNTLLAELRAHNNELTTLDVSKNTALTRLDAGNNQLTTLDVSNNTALTDLDVYGNKLTTLDVSRNTALTKLYIDNNPYSETLYVYKGNNAYVSNSVKVPNNLGWNKPTWTSKNEEIATVLDSGIISTISSGTVDIRGEVPSKYTTNSTVNVVEITSDKYVIDEENACIYIGLDRDINIIKNNLNISHENIDLNIDLENNKLQVKYSDNILKEFKLVSISSDKYDLSKDYIYIGTNDLNLNNINVINGTKEVTDNKLQIKYGETVLKEFKLVSISSDKYDLSKDYIYTNASTFDIDKVSVINGTKAVTDNKLQIKYGDNILKEYKLLSISFGELKSFENSITVPKNITYEDFINNITVSDGLAYKVFKDSVEVVSGNIEKDMVLKVYYNNVEIDMFTITDEYLIIDESIEVDEIGKYFSNIDFNTSALDILSKIDTTGVVTIKNNKNEVITGSNLVGTGSTVTIKLSKEEYSYTIIINGDIDGDGILKLSDIMKIANYIYKDKNSLSRAFIKAADFDKNGSINLSDIMKSAKELYGGK